MLLASGGRLAAAPLPVANIQITDSDLGETDASDPSIAVFGQTAYAVWGDEREGTWDRIYFAKSTDGGATWGANKRINTSPNEQWAIDPTIAVQPDGTIWVVWYLASSNNGASDNDLRAAFSTDGGQTFQMGTILLGDDGRDDLHDPQFAIDPATSAPLVLFHAYESLAGDSGYNIFLMRFDAQQQRWELSQVNDQARSGHPRSGLGFNGPLMSMAVSSSKICVAWEDRRDRYAIYGSCSDDHGQTFGPNAPISGADSVNPEIALAADGTLYAIYSLAGELEQNLLLRRSGDGGASWSAPHQLTDLPTGSFAAYRELAIDDGGQLVLAWVRATKVAGGNLSDLILAISRDQGGSFYSVQLEDEQGAYPEVAFQGPVALSLTPAAGPDRALIAWSDDRNVWQQIWLAQGEIPRIPSKVYLPAVQRP